jgi:hypothetical protein
VNYLHEHGGLKIVSLVDSAKYILSIDDARAARARLKQPLSCAVSAAMPVDRRSSLLIFPVPKVHALADQDYCEKISRTDRKPENDICHSTLQTLRGNML